MAGSKVDHHQFKHPEKPGKVTVPHPQKDLPVWYTSKYLPAGWVEMEVRL